jgi:hypothetical protein
VSLLRGHSATRGRVRGLDRFVATEADQSREVLVDPSSALPIEMNLMRGGTLVSHRTMRYEAGPGGTLVRRAMRSERLVSPVSGERAVVDTEFTSVRLERRR